MDRYIPNRLSTPFDDIGHRLYETMRANRYTSSPSSSMDAANPQTRQRLLHFSPPHAATKGKRVSKSTRLVPSLLKEESERFAHVATIRAQQRRIPEAPDMVLDAPGVVNDYNRNLMGIPASSFSFVLAYFVHFFVVSVITLRGVQHGGGNKKTPLPPPQSESFRPTFCRFRTIALHHCDICAPYQIGPPTARWL